MPRPSITRAHPWSPRSGRFVGRTFHTEREYRNALARNKGFSSWSAQQRGRPAATSQKSLGKLSRSERDARQRAFKALSRQRHGNVSLSQAARLEGTTPNTVIRHAGPAYELRGGRWAAKRGDRIVRIMPVLGPQGVVNGVPIHGSRQASLVGGHWNAVEHYLAGDESDLLDYDGVTVSGIDLLTDLDVIDELYNRNELDDLQISSDQDLL